MLVAQNVQRAITLTHRYDLIERGQVTAEGHSDDRAERDELVRRRGV
ncbi:MAG TPA: hypothetical protein VFF19_00260 [Reyranella sp.]|nr:hypothetical protein [Reyranella sp.]